MYITYPGQNCFLGRYIQLARYQSINSCYTWGERLFCGCLRMVCSCSQCPGRSLVSPPWCLNKINIFFLAIFIVLLKKKLTIFAASLTWNKEDLVWTSIYGAESAGLRRLKLPHRVWASYPGTGVFGVTVYKQWDGACAHWCVRTLHMERSYFKIVDF